MESQRLKKEKKKEKENFLVLKKRRNANAPTLTQALLSIATISDQLRTLVNVEALWLKVDRDLGLFGS